MSRAYMLFTVYYANGEMPTALCRWLNTTVLSRKNKKTIKFNET